MWAALTCAWKGHDYGAALDDEQRRVVTCERCGHELASLHPPARRVDVHPYIPKAPRVPSGCGPKFGPGMALPARQSKLRELEQMVEQSRRDLAERQAAEFEAERVMPATEAAKRGVLL